MDEFGLYPREEPFDPLGVMLFKALQVVSFLFFMALLAVTIGALAGCASGQLSEPCGGFFVCTGLH